MDELSLIGRETPVHVTKYDGSYHRRFPARFASRKGPLSLLTFAAGDPIATTRVLADDPEPYLARWGGRLYLYDDRWWNVIFSRREGRPWYYVNIATPTEFDGTQFHYVDLDLDIAWYVGEEPRVLDEDEFLDHSAAMRYPADVIERARAAVDHVLGLIGERAFPFDGA